MTPGIFVGALLVMTGLVGVAMTVVGLVGSAMAASSRSPQVIDGECRPVTVRRRFVRRPTRHEFRPQSFRHAPVATVREVLR
jgi:hypothetical protein